MPLGYCETVEHGVSVSLTDCHIIRWQFTQKCVTDPVRDAPSLPRLEHGDLAPGAGQGDGDAFGVGVEEVGLGGNGPATIPCTHLVTVKLTLDFFEVDGDWSGLGPLSTVPIFLHKNSLLTVEAVSVDSQLLKSLPAEVLEVLHPPLEHNVALEVLELGHATEHLAHRPLLWLLFLFGVVPGESNVLN